MPIITDGLVRYYHFKQGINGNVWENIAPAYKSTSNATLVGATVSQDGIATDGVDDYISVPNLVFPTNSFTMECMLIPENQSSGNRVIFGETVYNVVYISGGSIYSYAPQDPNTGRTSGNQLITNIDYGNPIYITYRYDVLGEMITIFINGKKHELPTVSSLINLSSLTWNDKILTFGRRGNSTISSSHLKGKFSFIRIYDKVLSDEEVANNYLQNTRIGLLPEKTKTVTITESFSDNNLEFPINTNLVSPNSTTFAYKSGTALDGTYGFLEAKSVATYTSAEIVFDIPIPPNSLENTLTVKCAYQGFSGDMFVNGMVDYDTQISTSQAFSVTDNNVNFTTYSTILENPKRKLVVTYAPYSFVGTYTVQVINISLTSILEDKSNYPIVTKLEADKTKISDEVGMNQSIIALRFDKDVTEYVARLNGSDFSTGVLVHQGGAVPANTDATVIIDWNELTSEGANKINIYGKGSDGIWTINQG